MVSLEGLSKAVDPSQLTADLEGSLDYDHDEWIEVRMAFEEFAGNVSRAVFRLDELQELVLCRELPDDLEGARCAMDEHSVLKKRMAKAPDGDLEAEGQRLFQQIQGCMRTGGEIQGLASKVSALLEELRAARQRLQQFWHGRKLKLDQCFQLRLFEQDAEKVGGSIRK